MGERVVEGDTCVSILEARCPLNPFSMDEYRNTSPTLRTSVDGSQRTIVTPLLGYASSGG
jgi:hypothetical protein